MKIFVRLVQLVAVGNIASLVAIVRVACTLPPPVVHVFLHVCHAPCYACPCMLAIYPVMTEVVPVLVVFSLYMIVADFFSFLSGLDTRSCKGLSGTLRSNFLRNPLGLIRIMVSS